MVIEILKQIIVKGETAKVGEKAEVEEKVGYYLVNRGMAKQVVEEKNKVTLKPKVKK